MPKRVHVHRDHLRLVAVLIAGVTVLVGAAFMATGRWAIGGFFAAIGVFNASLTAYRIWRGKHPGRGDGDPRKRIGFGFLFVGLAGVVGGLALAVAGHNVQHVYGLIIVFGGLIAVLTAIRGWPT